jgi:hypothetical protein
MPRIDYTCSRQPLRLGHLKTVVYAGVGLIAASIAYSFASNGIPILSGLNRLQYYQEANALEKYLLIYGPMIAFALGFYARKRRRRSINGVIMAMFMLFVFLIGNKFSLPIILAVCYFTPVFVRYLANHSHIRLFTWRRVALLGTVLSLLIMISFGAYVYALGDASHSYNLLVNRIFAFQGQMWWAVDYDVSLNGRYDPDHWRAELNGILHPDHIRDGDVGMKYLMVKVLGPEKAYTIFNRGYLYTHTYPAILIATFPYGLAAVIQFFAGMIFLFMLYYLYYSILYRHFIRAVFAMLVFTPYLVTLFSGNIAVVLTPALLLKVVILAVLEAPAYLSRSELPTTPPTEQGINGALITDHAGGRIHFR